VEPALTRHSGGGGGSLSAGGKINVMWRLSMIRRHAASLMALVVALSTFSLDANARPHGNRNWELLGSQTVGFIVDRDVVQVGRKDGDFSKIQLRVRNNDIEVLGLKVVYGNGQMDDISVREHIRAGGKTRAIDLRGGDRFIRNVQLVYRSKPSFKGQAVVEVWGRD
jgi:hypothetical protein